MPRINYIAEIRAFAAFASRSRLTANEFVLWHALLEMFNQESCGAHWPTRRAPMGWAAMHWTRPHWRRPPTVCCLICCWRASTRSMP